MNKKLFSLVAIVGILAFFVWKIWTDWETVAAFKWNFGVFDAVLFLMFLPLPFLFNVLAWHLITRSQGEKIGFLRNFEAWMFSNFARYLPGGIWQYPSRVLLLSGEGVPKTFVVKCLFLEALFVVIVGLLIVFLVFIFGGLNFSFERVSYIFLILSFLILSFFLVKSQKFMNVVSQLYISAIGKGQNVGRRPPAIKNIQMSLEWSLLLVFAYFLVFLFPSIILFLLAKGVVGLTLNLLYVLVGVYATSWLLGYIAFFAPAGIGVREAALAGFLSAYMPFSVAVVLVTALRVALFASEAIGFGLAVLLTKKRS